MQAIILAAGMGKRLKTLTADNTKCMVKVNDVTLIERALSQLDELGLTRIVIVDGYQSDKLREFVGTLDVATPIEWRLNPFYDKTNNIYSLSLAMGDLEEDDTLLLESDIIFEEGILRELVDDPRPTLALVDKYESWMDGTVVKVDEHDDITAFVPGKKFKYSDIGEYYKTVNIYKFSQNFATHYVPFLEAFSKVLGNNEYYEQVLRVTTMLRDDEMKAKRIGKRWYEIDDLQDLDIAESMFAANDDQKLTAMQGRYGGYWRYPNLLDFCYLVNPFYPPQRLINEMRVNFEQLFTQYPSGMRVNTLLAAKLFNVEQSRIMVGNGAAELIKALSDLFTEGSMGIIRPTFEEYPNRLPAERVVAFEVQGPDFTYTADDLMGFYADKDISYLVLINPDNPSGNYLAHDEVLRLVQWCEQRGTRLILDESFADFSDELGNTFITDDFLVNHPTVVLVKSISKSYGVPGVRLGVVASGDEELIECLKKEVAIWNINSFGEFYLQIAEKYKNDYARGMERFRATRKAFGEALSQVPGLRVVPSQANYFLVEVTNGMSSREVTRELLVKYDLIVKDLTPKLHWGDHQFLRFAVRNDADNQRLVDALKELLG